MSRRYLNVSAAAKTMGISRSILQHKIQIGEIESFEGKVDLDKLKHACPTARVMDTSSTLERMQFIKDNAYHRRIQTAGHGDGGTTRYFSPGTVSYNIMFPERRNCKISSAGMCSRLVADRSFS